MALALGDRRARVRLPTTPVAASSLRCRVASSRGHALEPSLVAGSEMMCVYIRVGLARVLKCLFNDGDHPIISASSQVSRDSSVSVIDTLKRTNRKCLQAFAFMVRRC